MEPQRPTVNALQMVSASLVGASGAETKGGPDDGAVDAFFVIAQLGLVPMREVRDGPNEPQTVMHLGLTPDGALDLATKLQRAAAMIGE